MWRIPWTEDVTGIQAEYNPYGNILNEKRRLRECNTHTDDTLKARKEVSCM